MTEEKFEEDTLGKEDEDDALTLDDLNTGYIGNPAVGKSVRFMLSKIIKLTGTRLIGKDRNGKVFKKNLSNVDYGYEVVTDNGSKYTVSSWEVFGKLKAIFGKLGVTQDVSLEITHLCDGMLPANKEKDKYKVAARVDGVYKTLDRNTKEWVN